MEKIIVIGCPGSGKSTFSRALHDITGIALYHLDLMYWKSDGTKVEKEIFRKRLSDAMNTERWIIDGNYNSTMEMRIQACDTVIFMDFPTEICLEGLRQRQGRERPDMPFVKAREDEDTEFLAFIREYNTNSRPRVMKLLEKYSYKDILIFKSRDEADNYLAELQKDPKA